MKRAIAYRLVVPFLCTVTGRSRVTIRAYYPAAARLVARPWEDAESALRAADFRLWGQLDWLAGAGTEVDVVSCLPHRHIDWRIS